MVSGIVLFIFALSCPVGIEYFVGTLVIWIGVYVLTVIDSYILSRNAHQATTKIDTLEEALIGET